MLDACRSFLASSALALAAGAAGAAGLLLGGCTPKIGGSCELSTDCSSQGDRVCDTAEPNGYCTVMSCKPNECPDEAACVDFNASVPGCMYSDREPSRVARSFCMIQCHSDGDCRSDTDVNGRRLYTCADPRLTPWDALILDDDQTQKVCIPAPDPGVLVGGDSGTEMFDAAVCELVSPILLDGGVDAAILLDAGPSDAADGVDATLDAGAPSDAGHD